jgi:hypothetical protein
MQVAISAENMCMQGQERTNAGSQCKKDDEELHRA